MSFMHDFFMFFSAFIALAILLVRLPKLLSYYLDSSYSQIVSCAILFHPFSIDAFLIRNFSLLSGVLAFILFVEAMICYKDSLFKSSVFLFIVASLFNLAYCFFPIFFFFYKFEDLKKYSPYIIFYIIGLFLYLPVYFLKMPHNPLIFLTYFSRGVLLPYPVNVINFALFPLSRGVLFLNIAFIVLFLFLSYKKKLPKELYIIIFLPSFASFFFPWTTDYNISYEFIFSPSTYMPITFGIILFIALNLSRKKFNLFFSYLFAFSLFWIFSSFPYSNILLESINNAPVNFTSDNVSLQRILAKQYMVEGRIEESKQLLRVLNAENPNNVDIKLDLNALEKNRNPFDE